jgi:hypothetical protein
MTENDKMKLQHWTQQIKDWESSRITQRAYCEREGLKYGTFDYWRRQICSTGVTVTNASKSGAARLYHKFEECVQLQTYNLPYRTPAESQQQCIQFFVSHQQT